MTYTLRVFGELGMDALLGAFTLGGLGIDPINQRLVPVELMLAGVGMTLEQKFCWGLGNGFHVRIKSACIDNPFCDVFRADRLLKGNANFTAPAC